MGICRQPFAQAGQRRGQHLLDPGDVQRHVQSARRTEKIFCRTGFDFRFDPRPARDEQLADLPARQLFRAGHVEQPDAISVRQFPYRPRRFDRRNRAAEFVCEQFYLRSGLQRPAELLIEPAITRVRDATVERRARDDVSRILQNNFLGGGLGLAIDMNRTHRVGLDIIPPAPVKDQVRGKEDELDARRESGQMRGRVNIHATGQIGILVRRGKRADGGAVDDELWFFFDELAFDGGEVEQIEIGARQRPHTPVRGKSWRGLDDIISNQSVRTGNPSEFHP